MAQASLARTLPLWLPPVLALSLLSSLSLPLTIGSLLVVAKRLVKVVYERVLEGYLATGQIERH